MDIPSFEKYPHYMFPLLKAKAITHSRRNMMNKPQSKSNLLFLNESPITITSFTGGGQYTV